MVATETIIAMAYAEIKMKPLSSQLLKALSKHDRLNHWGNGGTYLVDKTNKNTNNSSYCNYTIYKLIYYAFNIFITDLKMHVCVENMTRILTKFSVHLYTSKIIAYGWTSMIVAIIVVQIKIILVEPDIMV